MFPAVFLFCAVLFFNSYDKAVNENTKYTK